MTEILVPNHREISIDQIDVLPGRRALDPNWVETLAADFRERGQRTPGEVLVTGDRYRLIVGGHRLAARKHNGDTTFTAIVKLPSAFASEAEIKLAEIVENFMRRELSALDRAFDVADWRDVFEAVKGPVKVGRKAKSGNSLKSETISDADLAALSSRFADGFAEAAQRALRLSRPAVFRHLKIAQLGETIRQRIALLPIAENQSELLALVGEPTARRLAIVDRLLEGAANVADAIAILDNTPPAQPMARWEKVSETFSRLPASDQHNFFRLHEDAILQWVASRNG